MIVFCDNGDCCCIGEDGFCGCDKLNIVGGVCFGSYRSGRNVCDGDVDVRLKAENTKLRDLVELMLSCPMSKSDCDECKRLNDLCAVEVFARDLGIEVVE